jgi:hypothetical protein
MGSAILSPEVTWVFMVSPPFDDSLATNYDPAKVFTSHMNLKDP